MLTGERLPDHLPRLHSRIADTHAPGQIKPNYIGVPSSKADPSLLGLPLRRRSHRFSATTDVAVTGRSADRAVKL
jgi:hypothetical protein